ncbi:hypothetical protein [Mucilaginibacter phyllosphaerae]
MKATKTIIGFFFIMFVTKLTRCAPSGQQLELGNGYKISYNQRGGKISISDFNNNVIIGDQLTRYAFDSTFILAVQKPMDSIPECSYKNNESLNNCKLAFKKSDYKQYWIINKKLKSFFIEKSVNYSNVYGPFNKEDFSRKLKQLNVSENLKLKVF